MTTPAIATTSDAPLMVVVGSSNAAGMGASTYRCDPSAETGWRSPPTSWVGLLAASCAAVRIVNLSLSGAGSAWALRRSAEACREFRPCYMMFCPNPISDNDDGRAYLGNAARFVALCAEMDVEPILRGAYAYNGYDAARFRQMTELNAAVARLASRVLDHMECLADRCGHFIEGDRFHVDGLHPSDAGHAVLFRAALAGQALRGIVGAEGGPGPAP